MGGAPLDWAKEGSRFRVQGSGFRVQGSRFKVQGSRFKVQGCGGGFAANIYGAMPESGIQVTSPQSLATHPCFHTSGFWWRLRCILAVGIPVSSAFPSRGRCPEGADRAQAV